ncbi:lactase-phlorizin hydrolase-like isoform X2 [Pomacea canaliculata]|uniref:lactase-phlorizin hydrolase-like isoform X2 n=1 Tax=Pomacea canaliculata TaxID=400727 RepID=UPI000D732099|nr:lactase-phlorizin hydrolase-like isoform X2 [Pomacea canaliculata]
MKLFFKPGSAANNALARSVLKSCLQLTAGARRDNTPGLPPASSDWVEHQPPVGLFLLQGTDRQQARMWVGVLAVLALSAVTKGARPYEDEFYFDTFPPNFVWAAATAAYQVEGGWRDDGKGASIWDVYSHTAGRVDNGDTGDVACNSYNLYEQDVELLKSVGVNHYRFSISWPRLLPKGTIQQVNQAGVDYYNKLIDTLLAANIQPMVTLYHWDLPDILEQRGGWLNDETISNFVDYADFCFGKFGDRVKLWITFNEPWVVTWQGYGNGEKAPGRVEPGTYPYIAAHNIIRAHSKAYKKYTSAYKATQGGQVGITLNMPAWSVPADPSYPDDVMAQDRDLQFNFGWFANPIFGTGDYPDVMKTIVAEKSRALSLPDSRLPQFTAAEIRENQGAADFLGLNYYTSHYTTTEIQPADPPSYEKDPDIRTWADPSWPTTGSSWLRPYPKGLRATLNWLREEYDNVTVYITENGVSDHTGSLRDEYRITYIKQHVNELLKAIRLDGCNVRGYTYWSLMDNFEWSRGYSEKFGLAYVNFSDPSRPRELKASAYYYADLIKDNGFLPGFPAPGGRATGELALEDDLDILYEQFPDDFVWAAASSAYQIEGGWDADGKGESIWDRWTHEGHTVGGETGDVACDSYHLYREDVQLLRNMKVTHYRFSISWPRIMPDGTRASVNAPGVQYYNNLINELLANNIQPMVTLYHYDLPQVLEDHGGWLNSSISGLFEDYARFCFQTYGDRVKMWVTFYGPPVIALLGYAQGVFAPGRSNLSVNQYIVVKNIVISHALAYRTYKREFFAAQQGQVGISTNQAWSEPLDPLSDLDVKAAQRAMAFSTDWYAHPIFVDGDYPDILKWRVANRSMEEGLSESRLPEFTDAEKQLVKGSADFLACNFDTAYYVTSNYLPTFLPPSYYNDMATRGSLNPSWLPTGSSALFVTPFAMRKVLNWFKYRYNNIPVYVTENGVSDTNSTLHDYHRIHYHRLYISELLKAITLDKCNVKGYTAWSLMDSFEWNFQYLERYGLHYVNFSDPARPRTPKASAIWYRGLISDNGFKHGYTQPGGWGSAPELTEDFYYGTFPEDFAWAAATAAYQVEGGWNADGKGPSNWDTFSHTPGKVDNGDTGDVACDSYHRYLEDVRMIKDLGVTHYRFSISWSRLLPDGTLASRNQAGIDYYHRLIDALLNEGVQPMVTLYHWDLPDALQKNGGWLVDSIVSRFRDYADLCFREYGDKVKFWITFNEPWVFTVSGYGTGEMAPGTTNVGTDPYTAAHNVIKAHAETYHLYNDTYRATQNGKIGITLNCDWAEPLDPILQTDIDASDRGLLTFMGWFANPIYLDGDYPPIMRELVDNASIAEGRSTSRLPAFTPQEKARNARTSDFFGLNHYSTNLVTDAHSGHAPNYFVDRQVAETKHHDWIGSGSSWLSVVPWGIRKMVNWVRRQYGNIPIYITENGLSDRNGSLSDEHRIYFYRHYIDELLKAINLDKVNVKGYTAWSLMDNFEWARGYSEKFGLYAVDLNDPNRTRTPKASARFYRDVIKDNGFIKGSRTDPAVRPHNEINEQEIMYGIFEDDFIWGAATSAYQVEGGWNSDGKGESIWDVFVHTAGHVLDDATGDVAANSYGDYFMDVGAITQLQVNHYYFSLSWSRILPTGDINNVSQAGLKYYNNLLDDLVSSGVKPIVALHHWDLPQYLQQLGGWLNEDTADRFVEFARLCFSTFGDRVKMWTTLTEPETFALKGYEQGTNAPGRQSSGSDVYSAGYIMLKAHARVYRLYQQDFQKQQQGLVGINLRPQWMVPANENDPGDANAADGGNEFVLGLFGDPIFKGDYSETVKKRVGSFLPQFTQNEKRMLNGSADFYGLSFSRASKVKTLRDSTIKGYGASLRVSVEDNTTSALGLRPLLNELDKRYGKPVLITSIGLQSSNPTVDDDDRISYIEHTVSEVLKAVHLDDCNVSGYIYRSLVDGFEWESGYSLTSGLFHVDFLDPFRQRTPRKSARFFHQLVDNNGLLRE